MSKITFRADDALVERLEAMDASKSEVMREALREFLNRQDRGYAEADAAAAREGGDAVDGALADRVDELIEARLDERLDAQAPAHQPRAPAGRDVNVTLTVEGAGVQADVDDAAAREATPADPPAADAGSSECEQCGETVSDDHVYCPNCGEKRSHRVFCDCGDEVRTDWAFCPSCGRRTPAADVLDRP